MNNLSSFEPVSIIGLGNIGLRHLQGLGPIAPNIFLNGVDTDRSILERAESEWFQLGGRGHFGSTSAEIQPGSVVVIATSSRGRLSILKDVLENGPRSIILEKVVFQSDSDFLSAIEITESDALPVYVNCPRRYWPIYKRLRELINEEGLISIEVVGKNIGLACNAIHYVDAFQYLSGDLNTALDRYSLNGVVESKRGGYYECSGEIQIFSESGCRLRISAKNSDPDPTTISIETKRRMLTLVESSGLVFEDGSSDPYISLGRPPFQSELTGQTVSDLINSDQCILPTLRDSQMAHRPVLEAIGAHFERSGVDISQGVPIT